MTNHGQANAVKQYHQQTKHRFDGYARGPETLAWDDQPNPFRCYQGASLVELPLLADSLPTAYKDLLHNSVPVYPFNLDNLSQLLEISVAISAWKQYGNARWALRCNPSSGNLHPTEAYVIGVGIGGLDNGVYHYRADCHGLELRCAFGEDVSAEPMLLLGLTSVHWREAWKYGERAYRYCQHDVGHAMGAISFAAAALGWSVRPCVSLGDDGLAKLLGLCGYWGGAEAEHPDILLALQPATLADDLLESLVAWAAAGQWQGRANVLDANKRYQWPVIDTVAEACWRPAAEENSEPWESWPDAMPSGCETKAANLFRQRRSAQAFDGETWMAEDDFYRLLDHLLPRQGLAPWNAQVGAPAIELVFFIHKVTGLEPGLYCLPRRRGGMAALKAALREEFTWKPVADAPAHVPFYQLLAARAERTAARLCCQQAIAGTSAFSLAMIADFAPQIDTAPWRYRQLFWEAGLIGQVLYLEAEACGLRGTGIGCFFDDGVHELLGLQDDRYQSLYHFTVGGALTDNRIATLPPYNRISVEPIKE